MKLHLTWKQFDEAIASTSTNELREHEWLYKKQCPGIYGIPRGGLVVAVALSHYIELPLLPAPEHFCIVVDDVVETGRTMRTACTGLDVLSWAWVSKDPSLIERFYIFIPKERWVVFPWENQRRADDDATNYYNRQ